MGAAKELPATPAQTRGAWGAGAAHGGCGAAPQQVQELPGGCFVFWAMRCWCCLRSVPS